jgi:hypothetical protein
MLNRLGAEIDNHAAPPPVAVTLPELSIQKIPLVDDGAERREVAAKFLEARTIKIGAECWQSISKSSSFENWSRVAKALLIGKSFALRTSGASAPMGRRYALAFSKWAQQHHLDGMPSATRFEGDSARRKYRGHFLLA